MGREVILFDEPTSALDSERVGEVLQLPKDLSSEGCTMMFVTHEMEFARAVWDQVVFLEQGESSSRLHNRSFSAVQKPSESGNS